MRKYYICKILVVILLLSTQLIYAKNELKFKTLSVDDGLSHSSVKAITQDLRGNIWLGTQNGLNRWDGYEFTTYLAENNNDKSLNDDAIQSLLFSSDGRNLWVGTSLGLSCFNFQQNQFFNFTPSDSTMMNVLHMIEDDCGTIILATNVGVVFFDPKTGEFKFDKYLSGIVTRDITLVGENLFVATSNGLYKHSRDLGTTVRILPELNTYDISSIISKDNEYWIGTYGSGLYHYDSELQVIKHYHKDNTVNLESNHIHELNFLDDNHLLIGTFEGLSILNKKNGTTLQHYSGESSSIGHNSIRSIFVDNQNGIWLGSYYGGVSYYNSLESKFNVATFHQSSSSAVDNIIGCIVEDKATNNLWIGTNDEGLLYYDITTQEFTHYNDLYDNSSYKSNISKNIKSILPDKNGNIYFGNHMGGLNHLDRKTKQLKNYTIVTDTKNSSFNNNCYSLLEDDNNTLMVGTLLGLLSFDKKTKKFSQHPLVSIEPKLDSLKILSLFKDSKNQTWIGTNAGLYRVRSDNRTISLFTNVDLFGEVNQLKEVSINCVIEDSRGNIWIGANSGLFLFNEQNNTFNSYTTNDGLPNNVVYGILEDDMYRLWISTNKGLSCFDVYQNVFRNYSHSDGIANNQFNSYSYCKDKDGKLYFGGLGGLTYFMPSELTDNPYVASAVVEDFMVFNDSAESLEDVIIERDSVGTILYVSLPSELNLFSISFGAANPLSGNRILYKYKLDGFDTQWYLTPRRIVSYSNLPPGTYSFRVRTSNSDGKWGLNETVTIIYISPMWWQTLFARILFGLLFVAFIGVVIWFITSRIRLQFMLNMERKDRIRVEKLAQEKIRFYINLSHELRTPLTLILSPLQEIGKHSAVDKYIQTRLKFIYRSSAKLLYIVNQMFDYRKTELGMFELKVVSQDLDKIVVDVFSLFEKIAQNKDINYILNSELEGENLPVDRTFIEMILTNLLSNAFKFTPEGGIVKITLKHSDNNILIVIRDNGVGIAEAKHKYLFDRFYQVDESTLGTGMGLSIVKRLVEQHNGTIELNSKQGEFTELRITLPDDINRYSIEQRSEGVEPESALQRDRVPLYMSEAYVEDTSNHIDDDNDKEIILIADKSADICRYLVDNFRSSYKVYAVSDGKQALDILKTITPDLIIADRNLPNIDGLKLCQTIKQNIRTCHIPVIILASQNDMEDKIIGIEAGADDYVSKPFLIPLLQAKITNILKTKHRLQHYYSDNSDIDPDKITSNNMDGEFLKRAIKIVEQNMNNENFSSNDFAKSLNMSRSNLHIKMTSITGESSTKFIRKIRFNHACKLILERKYAISEISYMVGFSSPSYFATSFKKNVGCLPSEYVGALTK